MKKVLSFFVMLLPCLILAQNASELLVRWEGTRTDWSNPPRTIPMYYFNNTSGSTTAPSALSASNITGGGNINFNNADQYTGFSTFNLPTGDVDYGKYYQVTVSPASNKKIEAKNFKFRYYGYCAAYKVVYQIVNNSAGVPTDSSFLSNGTTLTTATSIAWNSEGDILSTFGSGIYVLPNQKMYVRIYPFLADPNNNKTFLRHDPIEYQIGSINSNGPAFYGVVSSATGVTAVADTATTFETVAVTKNVIENDQILGTTVSTVTLVAPQPAQGTVAINGTNITYTPTTSLGDKVIGYKVTGADGSTSSSTLTVTVVEFPSPTANDDSATTGKNVPVTVPVLTNDVAGSGTIGTISILTSPNTATGTATVSGNTIVFTPNASFTGTATITYKVTNSNNKTSNVATLTVNVVPVVAAVAQNDVISTSKNVAVIAPVLANDIVGNSPVTAVTVINNPAHGTAVVNADKTVTYTPTANYTGADSFKYKITDQYNTTSTATVSISVMQPSATGALCGTYVISAVPQAAYPQFNTITAAVNHLNQYGVNCPVTFLLMDDGYNNTTGETFPIVISQFQGTSTVNTVTFKPGYLKNPVIRVNDTWINNTNYQATSAFILNGADNIIFDGSYNTGSAGTTRNLTVFNNNSLDYNNRAVFWVASNGNNGANNITIKHVNIKQGFRNQGGKYTLGIYAGNNVIDYAETINNRTINVDQTAGADNNKLTVWNNKFVNVKHGVYINGNATAVTSQSKIHQNEFGVEDNNETIILPITLKNTSGFEVSENLIYNLYRNTTDGNLMAGGINITGNSSNGSVIKNNLRKLERITADAHTFAGIVLSSNLSQSNILIANNFILDVLAKGNSGGYSNGYGIIADNGGGYRILHNSVVLSKNQPEGGYSAALYVNSGASNLDVRNNIFVNTQTNAATVRSAIMVNNDVDNLNAIFSKLDYNNYYSTQKIGYIANQHSLNITWPENPDFVTALLGWQGALAATNNTANALNKDTHSISINPVFASATDLHLATGNGPMDDKGTFIAEIAKDIDGQLRNTTTPDLGADEFGAIVMPAEGSNAGIYCDSSTTWNGTSWTNGFPSAEKDVIFRANKDIVSETMYACSIYVENGAVVHFTTQSNAIVTHNVNVQEGSSLTFESNSNLIQIENAQNYGNVNVKRNSSRLKRLDYTLWSSPVTGSQTLLQFSPLTLTNRFYTYNSLTNYYNPYTDPAAITFSKAKSYLIRMPNNHSADIPESWIGTFTGTPNNGDVSYPLVYQNESIGYNAVGNPYPSPISVAAFIDANSDNIEGTLWIWRKTNDWTQTSYSTVTKAGYTANAAPGGSSTDNDLVADPYSILPDIGALNTAQGFIVKAKSSNSLVFRNSMRVPNNFANFFRENQESTTSVQPSWSRVWINVKNPGNVQDFTQTMIGYSTQTTLGYDNGFDGAALTETGNISLTSVISNADQQMLLAIQTRPAFTNADVVTLSFKAAIAGTFEFSIDHMDGLFQTTTQAIYLVDNLTGTTHNLKNGNYAFSTEIGTFNSRFMIVYATQEELGTEIPAVAPQNVIVFRNQNQISINAPKEIKTVAVYDMLGRVLYENAKVNATEFSTPEINTAQQVVIVKMTLENQQVVSKKIMMN